MSDIDLLGSVLTKDRALLEGIRPEHLDRPTPCAGFDVAALRDYVLQMGAMFARAAGGDAGDSFSANADEMVRGWREQGTERTVTVRRGEVPGEMALGMSLIEFVTHGCDLADATGQDVPFTDAELSRALELAQASLTEEFRGPGKAFGPVVDVPGSAALADRLRGFMGRQVPA